MNRTYRRRLHIPRWLQWMILTAAVFSALFVSLFVYLTVDAMITIINDRPVNPAIGFVNADERSPLDGEPALKPIYTESGELIALEEVGDSAENQFIDGARAIMLPTAMPLPTLESDERMTTLLMGVDSRPDQSFKLTDTMILFSYDPINESASMLSIPRDLYIDIPGYGRNRINTAFSLGMRDGGGDEGGAELAMRTVEHNLGVQVDHYVLVDFQTAINVVDAIGGLTIDVPKTIDDPLYPDMNYGYDPLYIEAGTVAMDGELALKYMRTRHGDTDFHRAERQQQVIMTFRDKMLGTTAGIANAPAILKEVRSGIFTSMTTNDILGLANAGRSLSAESIHSAVLDYEYVKSYRTSGGASVLVMQSEKIDGLIAQLFNQ